MAYSVFPTGGPGEFVIDDIGTQADTPVLVTGFAYAISEQRAMLADREFLSWPSGVHITAHASGRKTIEDFLRGLDHAFTPFLFMDPGYNTRGDLGAGPGEITLEGDTDGVNVDFTIPESGEGGGDYPIDTLALAKVFDDGASVTISSIDVDAREFTLAAAPADPSEMTADYSFYRLVRLVPKRTPVWRWAGGELWETTMLIEEVVA